MSKTQEARHRRILALHNVYKNMTPIQRNSGDCHLQIINRHRPMLSLQGLFIQLIYRSVVYCLRK